MRLVFAGTPAAAVPSLRTLARSDHQISAVITRADARIGRKRILTPSASAQAAEELGIVTLKTNRLDEPATEKIASLSPDLGIIVAYGGLVREPLLSLPRHGWINLHFSLLPRWRGAAPVQHSLIAGERHTGVSVFQLAPQLDAGDIFGTDEYSVPATATAGDVLRELAELGALTLSRVVEGISQGTAVATPQNGEPSFAPKLGDDEGYIRFDQPADRILSRIRGVTPEPGAHTLVGAARVKLLAVGEAPADAPALSPGVIHCVGSEVHVGTGTSPIRWAQIQPAGKGAMSAADWVRGQRQAPVVDL